MELSSIPTGMACAGVHRAVIEQLLRRYGAAFEDRRILDIPCGDADLVASLRRCSASTSASRAIRRRSRGSAACTRFGR